MSIKFTREAQIERDVFLSQIPQAVGDREYQISGDVVTVKDGSRHVRIELVSEGKAKKGAMKLPMKEIRFEFDGFSQDEVDEFMQHYGVATQRGGG